LNIKEWHQRT